ncbi:hypothetical protein Mpt1_c13210 [Candidatus Methanoplasma termitum]|uniref:DUF2240 family protein n=1 Tax=Candidatus Methanoplasma termitum TaxID=1577791 RepID=A0A0A7LDY2_9ARCH|nr:DUF2240 family protein [Candidatus Methanoplasma termitum]AIZ57183.1 hypothetical protein Mpt1_c13210 [Candidatus Methanoplasma termitum]
MPDELETCLAAIFLNKGKDVLTTKEFTMYASLDLRWMPNRDAETLMNILVEKGLMSKTNEYLRPAIDTSSVNVPVAYRPSDNLLKMLKEHTPKQQPAKKKDVSSDLLTKLIQKALESGMEKGAFVSECNKVSKRIDVSTEVAALMILREKGVDISPFIDDARSSVLIR